MSHKFGTRLLMSFVFLLLLAGMPMLLASPVSAAQGSGPILQSQTGGSSGNSGWDQNLIKSKLSDNGDNMLYSSGIKLPGGGESNQQDDILDQNNPNSVAQGILSIANTTENAERDQPEGGKNVFLEQVLNHTYNKKGDAVELDFMQFMIVHHVVAVYMANSCVNKAAHADLIAMCKMVQLDQAREITEMNYLLASHYGVYVAPTPLEQDEFILDRLAPLSGSQFDKTWLELMLPHHGQAVVTNEVCGNNAEHDDVQTLCQSMAFVQSNQITQMVDMLKKWYGVTMTTDPMTLAKMIENGPSSSK